MSTESKGANLRGQEGKEWEDVIGDRAREEELRAFPQTGTIISSLQFPPAHHLPLLKVAGRTLMLDCHGRPIRDILVGFLITIVGGPGEFSILWHDSCAGPAFPGRNPVHWTDLAPLWETYFTRFTHNQPR